MTPFRSNWLIALLTLAAFGLRVWRLDAQSLWFDEAFTVWAAASFERIFNLPEPPIFIFHYSLQALWQMATGVTEYAVRASSVLAGTLWVPATYQLARTVRLRWPAAAALLMAVNPFALFYSQESRAYAWAGLFATLAVIQWLRATRRNTQKDWLLSAALLITAFWLHYFVIFLIVGLVAWSFGARVLNRSHRRGVLLCGGLFAGALALWAVVIVPAVLNFSLYTQGSPVPPWALAVTVLRAATFGPRVVSEEHLLNGIAAAVWLLALAGAGWSQRTRGVGEDALAGPLRALPLALVLMIWVQTYVLQLRYPWFFSRYVLFVLPFLLLLAVQAASTLRFVAIRAGALAAIAALFAYGTAGGFVRPDWQRDDYRTVTAYIADRLGVHERVAVHSSTPNVAWERYWRGAPAVNVPSTQPFDEAKTAQELTNLLQGASGIWLFEWSSPLSDPEGFVGTWLERNAFDVGTRWFEEITVRHFIARPAAPLKPANAVGVVFGRTQLTGYDGFMAVDERGILRGALSWRAGGGEVEDWFRYVHLVDTAGRRVGQADGEPLAGVYGTSEWQAREEFWDEVLISVPAGTPEGWYWLELGMYAQGGARPVLDVPTPGGSIRLGPVAIGGRRLLPLTGDATASVSLTARDVPETARPGDAIDVAVSWSVRAAPGPDLTAFLHLVDGTGKVLAQTDQLAGPFGRPSSRWQSGMVLTDLLRVTVPANVAPGEYRLLAGLYDARTGVRLPIGPRDSAVDLGPIRIADRR